MYENSGKTYMFLSPGSDFRLFGSVSEDCQEIDISLLLPGLRLTSPIVLMVGRLNTFEELREPRIRIDVAAFVRVVADDREAF
jgi:hypothetical protein